MRGKYVSRALRQFPAPRLCCAFRAERQINKANYVPPKKRSSYTWGENCVSAALQGILFQCSRSNESLWIL